MTGNFGQPPVFSHDQLIDLIIRVYPDGCLQIARTSGYILIHSTEIRTLIELLTEVEKWIREDSEYD
jgi:hypothetical protein